MKPIFLLLLIALSCGFHHEPYSLQESSIINGQKVQPLDEEIFYSTAAVSNKESYCSGVLVSRDVVLTAAHCVDNISQAPHVILGNQISSKTINDTTRTYYVKN